MLIAAGENLVKGLVGTIAVNEVNFAKSMKEKFYPSSAPTAPANPFSSV